MGIANNKIMPKERKARFALWQVRGRQAGERETLLDGVAREGLVDKVEWTRSTGSLVFGGGGVTPGKGLGPALRPVQVVTPREAGPLSSPDGRLFQKWVWPSCVW